MQVTNDDVMWSPRMAGSIKRYHTWPTIQQQTVADHSFHVLRIWMQLWGAPRAEVTEYIICHDMGEMGPGDIPFGGKRRSQLLKQASDDLSAATMSQMWGDFGVVKLSDDERRRAKICDLLEMHEFGRCELALGNRLAEPVITDTWGAIEKIATEHEIEHIVSSLSGGWKWSTK